jgi:RNA polymerase-binding transcription factor DksA
MNQYQEMTLIELKAEAEYYLGEVKSALALFKQRGLKGDDVVDEINDEEDALMRIRRELTTRNKSKMIIEDIDKALSKIEDFRAENH